MPDFHSAVCGGIVPCRWWRVLPSWIKKYDAAGVVDRPIGRELVKIGLAHIWRRAGLFAEILPFRINDQWTFRRVNDDVGD